MKKSLFALLLGGLTIGITEFVVMGLLPEIAADLKISIPKAGHLISAYALGVVIGAPTLVILGRNFPPKKMLLILSMMMVVCNALSIIAPNYDLLLASRLLTGLPHGAFFGVGAVVASRLADQGKEAQAISLMFAGLTIANIAGVPLGTYIGQHLSWRYTFGLISAVAFMTFIFLYFWMPNLKSNNTESMKSQLQFFKKTEAWLIIAITAIGFGGLFCWISYIAPFLTKVSHFEATAVPYILILAGCGMFTGNLVGGKLADKFSPAITVLALLLVMALDLTFVYLFSGSQYLTLFFVFLTGCIAMALATPIQMLMIQTATGAEMIASAVIQGGFNIGNALGAFLGGLPLVAGYSLGSPNLVGVIMSIIGAGIVVVLILRNRKTIKLSTI